MEWQAFLILFLNSGGKISYGTTKGLWVAENSQSATIATTVDDFFPLYDFANGGTPPAHVLAGMIDGYWYDQNNWGTNYFVGTETGLWIIQNGPGSWKQLNDTEDNFGRGGDIQVNGIAICQPRIYVATNSGLIYKQFPSMDNVIIDANDWTIIDIASDTAGFPVDDNITSVDCFAEDSESDAYIVVGTANQGVGYSSDGGSTWSTYDNASNSLPSNIVNDVQIIINYE